MLNDPVANSDSVSSRLTTPDGADAARTSDDHIERAVMMFCRTPEDAGYLRAAFALVKAEGAREAIVKCREALVSLPNIKEAT